MLGGFRFVALPLGGEWTPGGPRRRVPPRQFPLRALGTRVDECRCSNSSRSTAWLRSAMTVEPNAPIDWATSVEFPEKAQHKHDFAALARGLLWYEQMQCRSVRTMPASDLPNPPDDRQSGYSQTALVLQGGGALGAYQAGVYQALSEDGCEPDWVYGISIGAIIAGNEPKDRLPRLYARVSDREYRC